MLGEWLIDRHAVAELVRPDDPRTWRFQGYEHYIAPGRIGLSREAVRLPELRLLALVAHECGHAVARARDVEARERAVGTASGRANSAPTGTPSAGGSRVPSERMRRFAGSGIMRCCLAKRSG